jgi:hypothetical protein
MKEGRPNETRQRAVDQEIDMPQEQPKLVLIARRRPSLCVGALRE